MLQYHHTFISYSKTILHFFDRHLHNKISSPQLARLAVFTSTAYYTNMDSHGDLALVMLLLAGSRPVITWTLNVKLPLRPLVLSSTKLKSLQSYSKLRTEYSCTSEVWPIIEATNFFLIVKQWNAGCCHNIAKKKTHVPKQQFTLLTCGLAASWIYLSIESQAFFKARRWQRQSCVS